MSKIPAITAKDVIKVAEKVGFLFSRQSGSHAIYKNQEQTRITVPIHGNKIIAKFILLQILKDLNLTKEEFILILKK